MAGQLSRPITSVPVNAELGWCNSPIKCLFAFAVQCPIRSPAEANSYQVDEGHKRVLILTHGADRIRGATKWAGAGYVHDYLERAAAAGIGWPGTLGAPAKCLKTNKMP